MAVKYVCDWCGSDSVVGRVTLTMEVAQVFAVMDADLPKFDQDLCKACCARLIQSMRGVVAMTLVPA